MKTSTMLMLAILLGFSMFFGLSNVGAGDKGMMKEKAITMEKPEMGMEAEMKGSMGDMKKESMSDMKKETMEKEVAPKVDEPMKDPMKKTTMKDSKGAMGKKMDDAMKSGKEMMK